MISLLLFLSTLILLNGKLWTQASEISTLCDYLPSAVIERFPEEDDIETICARFFNESRQNLVFILVDDMRYMLDSDPFSDHVVPNLIELSRKPGAVSFTNAQAVKSICTPSRVAILTGRRPRQSGNYGINSKFYSSNLKTFPGILAEHGYKSYAFGKIFDERSFGGNFNNMDVCDANAQLGGRKSCSFTDSIGHDRIKCAAALRPDESFSGMTYSNKAYTSSCTYLNRLGKNVAFNLDESLPPGERKYEYHETLVPYQTCAWTPNQRVNGMTDTLVPKNTFAIYKGNKNIDHMDFGVATAAIERIKFLHNESVSPFAVSVGIIKPHLPFSAPAEFFDYFNETNFPAFYNDMLLDEPSFVKRYFGETFQPQLPNGIRPTSHEIKSYIQAFGINNPKVSGGVERKAIPATSYVRRAMYATVKFADYLVGRIYRELAEAGVLDNTHIVITSDHGFQAGEYGRFGKWTTVEGATRIPLIFLPSRSFSQTFSAMTQNRQIETPVDHMEVFPTVLDLMGFSKDIHYAQTADSMYLNLKAIEKQIAGKSLVGCFLNSAQDCSVRSLSVTEYNNFAGKGDQIGLRSKFFRYIYFTQNDQEYLFDYRGGDFHRNIERVNCVQDKNYVQVLKYFRQQVKQIKSQGDEAVFSKFVGEIPFDMNYSTVRNDNHQVDNPDPVGNPNPVNPPSKSKPHQPAFVKTSYFPVAMIFGSVAFLFGVAISASYLLDKRRSNFSGPKHYLRMETTGDYRTPSEISIESIPTDSVELIQSSESINEKSKEVESDKFEV